MLRREGWAVNAKRIYRLYTEVGPPTRTPVSTTGVVHGCGANHFLSNAGSVQALNTFSRGAWIVRIRSKSRPSVKVLVLVVMILSFRVQFIDTYRLVAGPSDFQIFR
jgi:hypothetical protein